MHRTFCLLLCLVAAAALQAQQTPAKLGKLEGRTVNASTGEPIPRASLTLTGSGRNAAPRPGRSDSDGHFLIENVAPGVYRLTAERVGFLRQAYGARTPGGTAAPLNLSEGQHLQNLDIRMTPQGVVTGQVIDDEGDPVPRASVRAVRLGASGTGITNDIGEYRIAGLTPGRYLILATSQRGGGRGGPPAAIQTGAQEQALLPTYYPSAADEAAAVPVDIAAGRELGGVTIALRRGSLFRVQGKIVGGTPQDLAGISVSLMLREARSLVLMERAALRPDGSFEIARVRPGSYYLVAERTGRQGTGGILGKALVDVFSADILGLAIPLTEPLTVSGTVKMEGDQKAQLQRLTLSLVPLESQLVRTPPGGVTDTGAFKIASVSPDRYYLSVSGLPEGSYVKSVRLANQEVIDTGIDLSNARTAATFDVIVSSKGATVEGVTNLGDKPAPGSFVAILADPIRPEQPNLNKSATADQDGKFTFRGLAPGGYKLYAWEEPLPELLRDPGLAKPFEQRAVTVKAEEGGTQQVELKVLKPEDAPQ